MSAAPTFAEALRFWWRLGWISFGGPAGQIAIMHAELVERRRWIDEAAFLRGLQFCMLLPGPEAQQLATWIGWRLHGVRGGVTAGALFVLPSALLLWLLSWLVVVHGARPELAGVLLGLKAAVLALVLQALGRLARRTLQSVAAAGIALAALLALALADAPFPLVVLGAAALGAVLGRIAPGVWRSDGHALPSVGAMSVGDAGMRRRAHRAAAVCVVLWLLPLAGVIAIAGSDSMLAALGAFFARAALVTFGGAYAVLPYVAQHAVETHGWLDAEAMMVGLALAETTPGPLIMVLEYVGFVAAWNAPGALPPLLAATIGAALTVWVTFLPSFAFIFAGGPHVDRVAAVAPLRHALAGVTAGVIGVIANLALWFGAATLLDGARLQAVPALLAVGLLLGLATGRLPVPAAVGLGALAGLALQVAGLV